jgi:hypothetical protein
MEARNARPRGGELVARREAEGEAEVLELPDVELEAGGVPPESGRQLGGADAGAAPDDRNVSRVHGPGRARPIEPVQPSLEVAERLGERSADDASSSRGSGSPTARIRSR